MKKNIKIILLIIIVIIIILNLVFKKNDFTYTIKYNNTKFSIVEKHNKNNYYIEIKKGDRVYPFRIYGEKKKRIVNKLYYYKDEMYECVLPLINDKLTVDMMCINKGIIYNYSGIVGVDESLDKFISSIKIYNIKKFYDDTSKNNKVNDTSFYIKNSIDKHIFLSSYKGLTSNKKSIDIFDSDVYDNKISTFINNYYITADYNKNYEFNKFYVINLDNEKTFTINSKNAISFDSYIQGIIVNNIYLYDLDNEAQYEINIEKKSVTEISTNTKIKHYKNGEFTLINKPKSELYFDYSTLNNYFTEYDKFIETENYYYLFKKDGEIYELYRVDVNNINVIKYLFDIPTIDIQYKDDYIYYYNNGYLYYYSDISGLRTIAYNNELKFNDSIKYYIY